MPLFGGIEAGGTKFVCAIGTGPGDLRAELRFPTTRPEETIARAVEFFQSYHEPIAAVGIGAFGPVDCNPASPGYGMITSTPKPGWRDTDLRGPLLARLGIPVTFDTDVNAAAYGEYRWGAATGLDTLLYLTIGTGIGGGVMAGGRLLHGLIHPEIGHMYLPRLPQDWSFAGSCPYHGSCLEGLAAGPALERRWGMRGEQLDEEHPAWEIEAGYLALALANLIYTISPQRIVIGGGVMRPQLFPLVRREVQRLLNRYVQSPAILEHIDDYIVPPQLGPQSGVLGAIALAEAAYV